MSLSLQPSSLPKEDPRRIAIADLASVLRLDPEFDGYTNLIQCLIDLFISLQIQGVPDPDHVKLYLAGLRLRQEEGEEKHESRLAPTGRAGNPLGMQLSRYPIPAFLLQPVSPSLENQASGLKVIFLNSLLYGSNRKLTTIATELRKSVGPRSAVNSYLAIFPGLSAEKADYFLRLQHFSAEEKKNASKRHLKERQLLGFVSQLLADLPPTRHGPHTIPRVRFTPLVKGPGTLPLGGMVARHIVRSAKSEGEAPDVTHLFISHDLETEDPEVWPSEEEVDAAARQTRRWLSRHEKLIPGDHGRFMPFERRRIAQVIRDRLADPDRQVRVGTGILALSYLTGTSPQSVLDFRFGTDGEVTPAGTYVRRIARPADGYHPHPDLAEHLAPSAEKVELSLPPMVADWLTVYPKGSAGTLGECLATTWTAVRTVIDRVLEELRDGGRYRRIRIERIVSALPIELTLDRHDPALTHLLAGRASHAPPVLAYYVAHEIEYLQRVYADVVNRMMDSK